MAGGGEGVRIREVERTSAASKAVMGGDLWVGEEREEGEEGLGEGVGERLGVSEEGAGERLGEGVEEGFGERLGVSEEGAGERLGDGVEEEEFGEEVEVESGALFLL